MICAGCGHAPMPACLRRQKGHSFKSILGDIESPDKMKVYLTDVKYMKVYLTDVKFTEVIARKYAHVTKMAISKV